MRAANDDQPDNANASGLPSDGLTEDQQRLARERTEVFRRSLAPKPRPKRFYKIAEVAEADAGRFQVVLDGRPVHSPSRQPLAFASRPLAEAVAAEWAAQGEDIDAEQMPLTRLANTALDRVAGREDEIVSEIVSYAGSDLVCYRADGPSDLVAKQAAAWDPVLAWARDAHGADLRVTSGIIHVAQPAAALLAVERALARRTPEALAALHNMTTLSGSAVLAIVVADGHLDGEAVWDLAHLDEDWQIALWGEDAEAKARRAYRKSLFDAAVRFLALS